MSGLPPLFVILIAWVLLPVACVKVSDAGVAASTGGERTFRLTATVCGLPGIVLPPLSAANESVPLYVPAARPAGVTPTVNVAVPPLVTTADAGENVSHVPPLIVAVGVIVMLPVQPPMTPIVKVWLARVTPASPEKVSIATDGVCKVQSAGEGVGEGLGVGVIPPGVLQLTIKH